jgi:hypothetical protein
VVCKVVITIMWFEVIIKQWYQFALLQQCDPKMTSIHNVTGKCNRNGRSIRCSQSTLQRESVKRWKTSNNVLDSSYKYAYSVHVILSSSHWILG